MCKDRSDADVKSKDLTMREFSWVLFNEGIKVDSKCANKLWEGLVTDYFHASTWGLSTARITLLEEQAATAREAQAARLEDMRAMLEELDGRRVAADAQHVQRADDLTAAQRAIQREVKEFRDLVVSRVVRPARQEGEGIFRSDYPRDPGARRAVRAIEAEMLGAIGDPIEQRARQFRGYRLAWHPDRGCRSPYSAEVLQFVRSRKGWFFDREM